MSISSDMFKFSSSKIKRLFFLFSLNSLSSSMFVWFTLNKFRMFCKLLSFFKEIFLSKEFTKSEIVLLLKILSCFLEFFFERKNFKLFCFSGWKIFGSTSLLTKMKLLLLLKLLLNLLSFV